MGKQTCGILIEKGEFCFKGSTLHYKINNKIVIHIDTIVSWINLQPIHFAHISSAHLHQTPNRNEQL